MVGSVDEPGSQGVKSPGIQPQAGGEVALDAAEPRIDLIERRVQVALADAQNRQQQIGRYALGGGKVEQGLQGWK